MDKSTFRLIVISIISGIVFSGIVFFSINLFRNQQSQKSMIVIESSSSPESKPVQSKSSIKKLDLNQASLQEIIELPGIGEAKANAIIEFREKYGFFEDISELTYVPGIGNNLLNSIQDLVIIN